MKSYRFENLTLVVNGVKVLVSGTYLPPSNNSRYVQGDPAEILFDTYEVLDSAFPIEDFEAFFENNYSEFCDALEEAIHGKETWTNCYCHD